MSYATPTIPHDDQWRRYVIEELAAHADYIMQRAASNPAVTLNRPSEQLSHPLGHQAWMVQVIGPEFVSRMTPEEVITGPPSPSMSWVYVVDWSDYAVH